MKHLKKFNESEETKLDKLVYDGETKTMSGFYKVLSTDDDKTTLQNDQERAGYKGKRNIGYMDGTIHGDLTIQTISLDTSLITIGDDNDEGLTRITYPYWMYSLYKSKLEIKKLDKNKYKIKNVDLYK